MSVRLPALISEGMVLQRNAAVKLWGTSDEPVTVAFLGREYHAHPMSDGSWEIVLNNLAPGGPYTLTINEITLENVYVGDVWLCSGQSNMQLPMTRVRHMYPEEMKAENPHIRQFIVPQRVNFKEPMAHLESGTWAGAAPNTIETFSAVGYFFAKRLYEQNGVPIGLILTAIGGTPIHAWMSREALKNFPELLEEADLFSDDAYIAKLQAEDAERIQGFFNAIDAGDPGLKDGWFEADYDDSGWEERDLLAPWKGTGSFWLRKTVEIPPKLGGKPATLFLGTVIDWDRVYVNGQAVGNTTYRYPPREYRIPALPQGRCVITIRVISKDGGGFTPGKQYLLMTDEGAFDLSGCWRFREGGKVSPVPSETFIHYKPVGLFNGMIAPIKNYAVKGAIWYQGESDTENPQRYAEKFDAMVKNWRALWGYEFPFLFVELAHWEGGPDWDLLRREQRKCLGIPRTAMAAAFDLGEHNDLHPLSKKPVGDRLARCVLKFVDGKHLPHSPFEISGIHF